MNPLQLEEPKEIHCSWNNQKNPRKPNWLTIYMIVAYALPIVEEAVSSTYREAEISSEFKM